MNKVFILDEIIADFDLEIMTAKLPPMSSKMGPIFRHLLAEAGEVAHPKAAFKICRIEQVTESEILLNDEMFTSNLLTMNLMGLGWAFAYVATEGDELVNWIASLSSANKLLAWPIRYAALKLAEKAMVKHIKEAFGLCQISMMNPGSLDYWSLDQQVPLFRLLSPLPKKIGVKLTPHFWMSPELASSGIAFYSETQFYNCQLCQREPCPKRKAAYQGMEEWMILNGHCSTLSTDKFSKYR